jgi:dTDP-4-dehydrorhamnose reductase
MIVLVTGSNGQLGMELRELAPSHPDLRVIFTDLAELDITDPVQVRRFIFDERPDVVINCAAYTAVDKAETEAAQAMLINGTAVGNLAVAAKQAGASMVQISTDYVFDGNASRPYAEDTPMTPVSAYGKSKAAGETILRSTGADGVIFRTSWLYSSYGVNFVKTILKAGPERGHLDVVCDQIGSPTYARDLARVIMDLLYEIKNIRGMNLFHYANAGVASWYDFAMAIRDMAALNFTISPITTDKYPARAQRPFYSVLDKEKIMEQFGVSVPYWRDSLLECIRKIR